ncbi:general substrate transporter [Meredithblackwellia eburnea MCA 4105]
MGVLGVKDLTGRMLLVSFATSLGAINYGYDNSWWSGALGEVAFADTFGEVKSVSAAGVVSHALSSTQQSLGTALSTTGIMLGCLISAPLSYKFGRRPAFAMMGVISLIGVLIEMTIGHSRSRYYQLVAGRIIVGVAMGMAGNLAPVYQSECSPARIRGALASFYAVTQTFSAFISTVVIWQVQKYPDSRGWLIPIGVQFVVPPLMIAVYFIIPESPRFLVMKGRSDEALTALRYLRSAEHDCEAELAEIEVAMAERSKFAASTKTWDAFRGTNLRRTLVAIGIQCFSNAQGIGYVVSYLVVLFIQLGITNTFEIVAILYAIYACTACFTFVLMDRFGRRPLTMGGSTVQAICMIAIAVIVTIEPTPQGARSYAVVFLVYLWCVVNSFTWGAVSWAAPAELPSASMRETTMALATFSGYGVNLIVQFVSPYIQSNPGNLSGRIGYIWASFSILAIVYCFFFLPETKGRTLEELDILFNAKVPTLKFGNANPEDFIVEKVTRSDDESGKKA